MRPLARVFAILSLSVLAGCGNITTPMPSPTPTATAPPTSSPTATVTPSPTPSASPTATATEIVFTIVKLISPIKAGRRAQLTIKTTPGAECFLSYITPAGTTSTTQGLGKRTATADGICGWTWSIRSNTRPGTGTLEVTVNGVTVSIPIVIE